MSIAAKQTEQEPSIYTGCSFAVEEIQLGMNVLQAKVRDLGRANKSGSAVDQKLMAENISKIAGQIQALADVVARVTVGHLNRKPRIRA